MVLTSHYLTLIVRKQCCCEIVSDCWGGSRGYIQNEHCSCVSSKSVHWKTLLHMCTVHSASPPRGYIQSAVPSPLIRRPQSHRVQLLWLKNTPIPIFTRLSMEKTSLNPSSHNKSYTLRTCILETVIFLMGTRTAKRPTLVEYIVMSVLATPHWQTHLPSLANSKQRRANMRWILWLCVTSLSAKPRHLGWKNGLDREKVHCGLCRCCRPPASQKQWSHNNNCRGNNNNHTHNCDQAESKLPWKASATLLAGKKNR